MIVRTTPPAASARARWAVLAVLCTGLLMIILDGTIVTVALPAIQSDLGFSPADLAWVVNAYLVPFGGLLLLAGRLGDLVGRRTVLLTGLTVFVLASLLCGLAGNATVLVVARFVQGAGGAMASAVVLGMIVTLFPEPGERGRAIGVYSFVGAAGASIGLLAGGVLTQAAGWHWIFLVNVPIGIVAVVLSLRLVEPDRGLGVAAGADVLGAVLVTAGVMLGVYAIVDAESAATGRSAALGAAAVALLGAFLVRQARAATPLLALRIFRSRTLSGANAVQALLVAAMLGFQFTAALYLQRVLGYSPARTGLAMLPVAVVIGTLSLTLAGRLMQRHGPRAVLLAGQAVLVPGLALLSRAPLGGSYPVDVLPAMLLLGVGAGLVLPSVTTLAMSDATPQDAGVASGLANTTQQVGGALGTAVLATLAATGTAGAAAGGAPASDALNSGYHVAFAAGAVLVAAALTLTAAVLRSPATST